MINLLFDIWGQPTVDVLFATWLNNKVEAFFTHLPDPLDLALQGNSLQADWSKGLLYMYLPIPLLSLALNKVISGEAQVIAILPWWSQRGWLDLPVMLPECDGLLLAPDGTEFPDLRELCLATWRLSGDIFAAEVFKRSCCHHAIYVQPINRRPELCTMSCGGPFVAGDLDGRRIPFTCLSEWCRVICSIYDIGVLVGRHPLVARWVIGLKIHPEDPWFPGGVYRWFWWH